MIEYVDDDGEVFVFPRAGYGFYSPHERVIVELSSEEITKQSFRDECDINNILSQFSRTGIINHVNSSAAEWLDLPDNMDFQSSIALVQEATEAFASLPSKVRDRYKNDPGVFLAALVDPNEHDALVDFGVLKPRVAAPSSAPEAAGSSAPAASAAPGAVPPTPGA